MLLHNKCLSFISVLNSIKFIPCMLKVYKINNLIMLWLQQIFSMFQFICNFTLKDGKRKQLTFFRKSANRCESQLRTSDLDGILSKLIVPNLLHLLINIKFQITSSIEKIATLTVDSHCVWRYVHREHEETGAKPRKIKQIITQNRQFLTDRFTQFQK